MPMPLVPLKGCWLFLEVSVIDRNAVSVPVSRSMYQLGKARRHLVQRQDFIHAAVLNRLARHTPHYAGLFILNQRMGTGIVHLLESARTVVAHAGEYHTECVRSDILRDRAKQYIHRG